MTTWVVVREGATLALAADSLVTFGDTRLAHGCEATDKLFRCGNSWIGTFRTLALGAMNAAYDQLITAAELARPGFAPVANSTRTPVGRCVPTPSP